ncbi:hypothetical protein AciX9_2261 [Granulicella tundricola MP5ACTX9]|uniref:Uncharacterized protein n=1 Tax=Granulicella tundricola (strain ATCC BAA-1859 / DSM 23138 / MP5ACTX9) TaxID=1198114 RepID=E8X375_GRATM|nr:hypothetical protein AciX9_2261 [Granulicella tundricola MP5ACTX9]
MQMPRSSFAPAPVTGIIITTATTITAAITARLHTQRIEKPRRQAGLLYFNHHYAVAYFTIRQNVSGSKLAPPTSAPSIFG